MRSYYRLMLGRKSVHAEACIPGEFVGTDFGIHQDLTGRLPNEWRDFNREFIPIYLENNPDKTKIAAGLACGAIHTVSKGMAQGDIVLCPDGTGQYRVGEITGDYTYAEGEILPHRRPVRWSDRAIDRADMSEGLRKSCSSAGTVSLILKHSEEIERLHKGVISWPHETVEDPAAFAMEKHLEDFLIKNWSGTELSGDFDIYEEDGEKVDKYALRMTVSVRHRGKTQIVIRANAQFGLKPVTDPEPYQQFFTSLGKAMFLTAHQVD